MYTHGCDAKSGSLLFPLSVSERGGNCYILFSMSRYKVQALFIPTLRHCRSSQIEGSRETLESISDESKLSLLATMNPRRWAKASVQDRQVRVSGMDYCKYCSYMLIDAVNKNDRQVRCRALTRGRSCSWRALHIVSFHKPLSAKSCRIHSI